MKRRNYFFDPASEDRFSAQDIPTEQTMRNLLDSVAFHMELNSCATMLRAGLVKMTPDEYVNAANNNDLQPNYVTPLGAPTTIRPAQIPQLHTSPNSGILLSRQVRSATTPFTDTGGNIEDYWISLDPAVINAASITSTTNWSFLSVSGTAPVYSITTTHLIAGSSVQQILTSQNTATNTLANKLKELADVVQTLQDEYNDLKIDIGEVVLTHLPSAMWNPRWLEPNGQTVHQATYPALFAKFGTTFNIGGEPAGTFRLPNWTNRVIRVAPTTGAIVNATGGADAYALTSANIPLHAHAVNLTTSNAGVHNHNYDMKDDDDSNDDDSGYPETGNASGTNRIGYTENAGAHTHTVTGNTDNWGQNTPIPVDTLPSYRSIYLKMRVL